MINVFFDNPFKYEPIPSVILPNNLFTLYENSLESFLVPNPLTLSLSLAKVFEDPQSPAEIPLFSEVPRPFHSFQEDPMCSLPFLYPG